MQVHVIEYLDSDKTRWYLTVGRGSPWNNYHIRVPYFVVVLKTFFFGNNNG